MPIEPARLSFTEEGTPCSTAFGDVYHSRDGGLEQARHVFIAGNELPGRWQRRERFTIVETGFGLGLNFLATWAAWRDDPRRCGRLHFVSVERHPFRREDLATLHARWPELAPLTAELQAQWPVLMPGLHRLHLDGGRIILTLMLGDALELLPQLQCRADAFYLDGFSPAANPELWSAELLHELPQLAAPGATLATWSVTGTVRRALAETGFRCEKAEGFGGKREMLRAQFDAPASAPVGDSPRHALVLGAGLAGSSIANRLAERGWSVEVIDAAAGPGAGASGNLSGVLRPLPSLDDNRLARITRAGALYGLRHLRRLSELGLPVRWDACGVLHLARDPVHEEKQRRVVEAAQAPDDFLRFVDREQAAELAGWPVAQGGWWFPGGGWVNPPSLCAANLAAFPQHIRCHYDRSVAALEHGPSGWRALDAAGQTIAAAPVAILANGTGIGQFPQAAALPVRSARGQVSHLPALPGSAPRVVVCRLGYVSPEIDGVRCAGATFSVDDDDPELRLADHRENLAKLNFILPDFASGLDPAQLGGRVGFRPASPDRLPMIGAIPSILQAERSTPLASIPRHPGLYAVEGFGARGLVWAALAAELLASELAGDALPLERALVDALDPARYLLRPPRRAVAEE
ncbi:bifunctional tRNA (5-methylaminomethyl-2-thiouridine)(34)-methyltransferase MnmD/FAD-dependent 5-carboxymethylaminomethyl-2-thiouridine(34) oxidoreductase MnmC [Aromatoleum toluvorans]|uniref:tRNA 5-methylaminomethyl-2-thiouridine biosynthesis bifunctional protein MnmC n=1 Tax=Aromatoleum toluvorans TaxID=92002 RepID=A0ABX1PUP1_9RHOO|nr:bifunctional tRNA (5-methylaminomethyl-2-thiouridine)(34)-methyltransferase MnmD/FAD-dependent 5-carboxymethylaminomethyl-2-thiouridine(34) oxidoreductase MnmC [Aromatoleum toluvorans]NMG42412.1 bifunctional tRNA (5-methylaminomethyl-2-thiouridine)(34)-methyltransferase MnmD/FAD-dependent 5-carboxymethylaminomethyl-2-thiouridine(34) oxidoreductase MnmC [Aromatoleum toluvorans]